MPLTKSAKKAELTERRRKIENDATRAKVKEAIKGAKIAITKGEKDAEEKISKAYRELDVAAKKNVIHKNKASRLKSRLAKKLKSIESGEKKTVKKVAKKVEEKAPVKSAKKATKKPATKKSAK